MINSILPALIGLVSALIGALFAGLFSARNEKIRSIRETKKKVYQDYLINLVELSSNMKLAPQEAEHSFLQSRAQVIVYACDEVIERLAAFHSAIGSDAAYDRLFEAVAAMRRDVGEKAGSAFESSARQILIK